MDSADPAKRARSKAIQAQLDASRDQIQRLTAGKVSRLSSTSECH